MRQLKKEMVLYNNPDLDEMVIIITLKPNYRFKDKKQRACFWSAKEAANAVSHVVAQEEQYVR